MEGAEFQKSPGLFALCRIGYLQFPVRTGEPDRNLASVQRLLTGLSGREPTLLVLPELWATGFAYERLAELAAETPRLLEALQALAASHQVVLAGSLPEAAAEGMYNTLFLTGPAGTLGRYRKQQLFGPLGEEEHFLAGLGPRPMETPLGLVGGLVCYDLRFADLARHQAEQGAGLLAVSAQWPAARRDHWQTLLRARAIENQLFVVGANACGRGSGGELAGHSLVVAPDGRVLAEAGEGEEVGLARLEPAVLACSRRQFSPLASRRYRFHAQDKIVGLDQARRLTGRLRAHGGRLVFTNGCFDILHPGHVSYLEQARRLGDGLVVGLNSDQSVRGLDKGGDRPINPEGDRARVLAGLDCVDWVVLFAEPTPLELIRALRPEVLVKGGDWPVERMVGAAEVLAAGGQAVSIPLEAGYSTTGLLERIRSF